MKVIAFCILLLLLPGYSVFAQVKNGTYKAIGDSILGKTGRVNDNSQLFIYSDHTFSYEHRTVGEAAISFDRKGTWTIKSNKLFLNIPDSACKAVFKIQGNILRYLFNMCDPEKPGWRSKQLVTGNFLYKQE